MSPLGKYFKKAPPAPATSTNAKVVKGSKYDPQIAKDIADRDDLAKDPLGKMFPADRKSALGDADERIKAWHALASDDIAQQRSQDPAPKRPTFGQRIAQPKKKDDDDK